MLAHMARRSWPRAHMTSAVLAAPAACCSHAAASRALSLHRFHRRRRGWYLATKDASGPNLGPLTPAERCECDATTLAAFAAAAKAARVKFATGSSAYRGVGWR